MTESTLQLLAKRLLHFTLAFLIVLNGSALPSLAQESGPATIAVPMPKDGVKKGQRKLTKVESKLSFSTVPDDKEIAHARVFEEPLHHGPGDEDLKENKELASALLQFKDADDPAPLLGFLNKHGNSRWRASLEFNLGSWYYANGYMSKAMELWQSALELSKSSAKELKPVADCALAELIQMNARLGRKDQVKQLLTESGKRT